MPRVSFSVENPAETTETNLMSTVKLFDAARYGKSRVVFFVLFAKLTKLLFFLFSLALW